MKQLYTFEELHSIMCSNKLPQQLSEDLRYKATKMLIQEHYKVRK